MTEQTLQQLLDASGDIVELLRNQQSGPNVYPGVPAEYSNWRSEQQAWAKTCVLFNQSFHMFVYRSYTRIITHPRARRR